MFTTFVSDEIRFMLVIEKDSETNAISFKTESGLIDWDKVRQFFKADIGNLTSNLN